jgi:hypothetical protein
LLLSACAGAPEQAETASPQAAAVGNASAVTSAAASASAAIPVVVDANRLAAVTPAITCREMLKRGSNVIIQRCMTGADWKRYERREAQDAAEMVRALQGGRYR